MEAFRLKILEILDKIDGELLLSACYKDMFILEIWKLCF